jgi:hypothetical protein
MLKALQDWCITTSVLRGNEKKKKNELRKVIFEQITTVESLPTHAREVRRVLY